MAGTSTKSTKAKGTQFQGWCADWIKKNNPDCAVHNFKSTAKKITRTDPRTLKKTEFWVSQDNDLWNCIDLAVYLRHCPKPIFIQATAHTGVDKRLVEMAHVPWDFDHVTVQLWQKKEPGRVVVQQLRYKTRATETSNYYDPIIKHEFYKIGEIKRGKYIPIIGKTLCDGSKASPQVL